MILVSMGTQPIQCDRIINTILNANLKEDIVIQAYNTLSEEEKKKYKNVKFISFVPYDEMTKLIDEAEIVIVSGTGGIFRALTKNKKVIIFPRLGKYGEAVNDHGLDMKVLESFGYASFVEDEKDFVKVYNECKKKEYKKFKSNQKKFVENLDKELKKL